MFVVFCTGRTSVPPLRRCKKDVYPQYFKQQPKKKGDIFPTEKLQTTAFRRGSRGPTHVRQCGAVQPVAVCGVV